jgi:TRAP-type C4-dicarboxylate transport system permease small subunit
VNVLRALDRILVRVEEVLLVLFLGTMVLLAFTQVMLRNLFGTGLLWADPLVRHFVLWSGFLGGALATSAERHINVDALTRFLSPRIKAGTQVLTNLFAGVACFFLAQAAWAFTLSEQAAGSTTVLDIPVWVAALIVPGGYGLMMLHFVLRSVENVLTAAGHETAKVTA